MSDNPYPDGLPGTLSVGERNTTPGEPYEIAIIANEMRYCPFVALPCGEGSGEKVDYAPAFTEANARRLVAAWNACRHLTTEQLESGKMAHAAEVERLTGERDALHKQLADVLEISTDVPFDRCILHAGERLAGRLMRIEEVEAERDAAVRERDALKEELRSTNDARIGTVQNLQKVQGYFRIAKRERDAAVEALKKCLAKGSRWHPCDPVVVEARAALAKIEGEHNGQDG